LIDKQGNRWPKSSQRNQSLLSQADRSRLVGGDCSYILDLNTRGFVPRLTGLEDMENYILESRSGKRVGKLWAHRFVRRQPDLQTRFNLVYDFQRALCEDNEVIGAWFRLVQNMRAKYGI
jgi:hypothetical protein